MAGFYGGREAWALIAAREMNAQDIKHEEPEGASFHIRQPPAKGRSTGRNRIFVAGSRNLLEIASMEPNCAHTWRAQSARRRDTGAGGPSVTPIHERFRQMRIMIAMLALLAGSSARADAFSISFPVAIPQECVAAARQQHVPTIMNSKFDAIQAAMQLDRLSDRDPAVRQCKQTVARLRAFL